MHLDPTNTAEHFVPIHQPTNQGSVSFSVVKWWRCSREWLLVGLTPSCICFLVCLTVCLTTWCRARYQILIPLPSKCVCPWVWLTECSRLSSGTTAERWETTGTGGLKPYKGLNTNVLLLSLPYKLSIPSALSSVTGIGKHMFMHFSCYYQEFIHFLLPLSSAAIFFLLFFFFASSTPAQQECGWHTSSRETESCTLWLGSSFDHSGEKAFRNRLTICQKNFQKLHNHSQPHSFWLSPNSILSLYLAADSIYIVILLVLRFHITIYCHFR